MMSSRKSAAPNPAIGKAGLLRPSKNSGRSAHGERGSARLKSILWIAALAAFIFVSVKVLPALVNDFQFQDGIQTIARYATATRQTPDQIRADVLKEAKKNDLPIDANDVKVEAVSGNVRIHVEYSVTVDLTVYQWTLNFHPAASNDSLT
jgi:hypothetical protein